MNDGQGPELTYVRFQRQLASGESRKERRGFEPAMRRLGGRFELFHQAKLLCKGFCFHGCAGCPGD